MNDNLKILSKFFIFIVIESLVLFFLMTGYTANYDKLATSIYLNGQEIQYYGEEGYKNYIFPIRVVNRTYNYDKHPSTKIDKSDKYIIDINECEVYYKSNNIRNNYSIGANCGEKHSESETFKIVDESDFTMKIYRKNELIYDGEFKNDVTKYIVDEGRYFFHIYGKRKVSLISSTKNHITFNIIIGGDNDEE